MKSESFDRLRSTARKLCVCTIDVVDAHIILFLYLRTVETLNTQFYLYGLCFYWLIIFVLLLFV